MSKLKKLNWVYRNEGNLKNMNCFMTKVRGSMLRDKGKQLMHICRPRKIRQKTRRIRERKKQRAGGNRNSVDGARRKIL
jgi:hypothetical protein